MGRLASVVLVLALSCSGSAGSPLPTLRPDAVRSGPFPSAVQSELDEIFSEPVFLSKGDIGRAGRSNDARTAWPLVDLLRFQQGQVMGPALLRALATLTGVRFPPSDDEPPWVEYTNLLLRENVPAPPDYFRLKSSLYLAVDDRWEPFFDPDADLDWREVTWGGVFRDAIQALNDPPVVGAELGSWLPDDDVVFGVVVEGEARAYPRRVLDVHELANDTLGGRRIGLPYCTLCGSAIPYLTDSVAGMDKPLKLRTSGLIQRSNKLMYDSQTESLFDQFSGRAVTGRLREASVTLPRLPITVTTWGEWKEAHPQTTVTPEEIGGRRYGPDPLGDRDLGGPIFPVGEIDPRLPAQEVVFGLRTPGGEAIAFPVTEAREALADGRTVELQGVVVRLDGGGLRASLNGREILGHEAYWFAWSQFNEHTLLWRR